MKEIVFNRKDYISHKEFYENVFRKLDEKNNINFENMPDMLCDGNNVNEFLWYNYNK